MANADLAAAVKAKYKAHSENVEGNVTFDHVRFGYDSDKVIIHDFNSQVAKGEKIAIVGPTGAGKTTIVKLLMRFYDVNSGAIRLDGHNICDFQRSDLRHIFGMVLQDTWLSSNISQGQKQLLTIARTILADPRILILDEATSSVDPRTEEQIQKAMDTLMEGRTCFIIAHRLSTITNADQILVMKDGDIIEQGTHEALLAQGGFYASLYNSQFQAATA